MKMYTPIDRVFMKCLLVDCTKDAAISQPDGHLFKHLLPLHYVSYIVLLLTFLPFDYGPY